MDYNKACSILSIQPNFTLTELKKIYYKEALKNHPDKNGSTEKFQEINEAYNFLLSYDHTEECNTKFNMVDIIYELFKSTSINDVLDSMSGDMINHIYDLLPIIKQIIQKEQYDAILKYMDNKFNVIILEPTLDDLFQQKVFIYKQENKTYRIPLWIYEMMFDTYIFKCKPNLPENIIIDDSNNIIITIYETIQTIFSKEEISVLHFKIKVSELYIKPFQIITFRHKGIPIINTENVFHIQLSNVIIYINLSC